jgi:hypothetical protein
MRVVQPEFVVEPTPADLSAIRLRGGMVCGDAVGYRRAGREGRRVGYYMRYIVADDRPVAVGDLRTAFAGAGAGYEIEGEDGEATITHAGQAIGQVTVNIPGDGLFDEELEELVELAQESEEQSAAAEVVEVLRAARAIVAVQVLFGDRETERTLDLLAPLWTWLQVNREGLIQADGEGYYDGQELILALE